MEESNKNNKNLIIVIVIMATIILGLSWYIVYEKLYINKNNTNETNKSNTDENKEQKENTNENEIIETSITKEKANEELNNSIGSTYYAYKLTTSPVGTNIFDSDYAKLYLTYMITLKKDGYISEECYSGERETGCAAIDFKKYEENYKNLFGLDFSTNKYEELNKSESYYGYRDNKFFGSFPTGISPDTLLKATSIIEKKRTIEIDVDVINFDEESDIYEQLVDSKVTEYDNKLVVAKYKLILTKNDNKTYKIDSFTRIK